MKSEARTQGDPMTPKNPLFFWCPIYHRPVVPTANTCPACGHEIVGNCDHIVLMLLDRIKLSSDYCLNNSAAVAEIIFSDIDEDAKMDLLLSCSKDNGGGVLLEDLPIWTYMVETFILPRFDELSFVMQAQIRWHFKRKYHFNPDVGEPPKGNQITFDLSQLDEELNYIDVAKEKALRKDRRNYLRRG